MRGCGARRGAAARWLACVIALIAWPARSGAEAVREGDVAYLAIGGPVQRYDLVADHQLAALSFAGDVFGATVADGVVYASGLDHVIRRRPVAGGAEAAPIDVAPASATRICVDGRLLFADLGGGTLAVFDAVTGAELDRRIYPVPLY